MNQSGNKETIAKNIRYYMDRFGKSRQDMCKALDVKYTTFSDWVNGNSYPRIDKIEAMANYFGISKSALVEKQDSPEEIMQETFNRYMEVISKLSISSSYDERLTSQINRIIHYYLALNPVGQEKALDTIEDLYKIYHIPTAGSPVTDKSAQSEKDLIYIASNDKLFVIESLSSPKTDSSENKVQKNSNFE